MSLVLSHGMGEEGQFPVHKLEVNCPSDVSGGNATD